MTGEAQISRLPDGRLHLHHGPIDVILSAEGPEQNAGFAAVARHFPHILPELVKDLPLLSAPVSETLPHGPVAQAMHTAVAPLATDHFVTPMAAVAGAVADALIATLQNFDLTKAVANNGGDIAFLLADGEQATAAAPVGPITIPHSSPVRGLATSGWRGRSQSLGIADAVTVLATTAARADAAATLIANAVDLPGHPAITRRPAHEVEALPQLNERLVTTAVGPLTPNDTAKALTRGLAFAETLMANGLIEGAALLLNGVTRLTASADTATALPADRS